MNTDQKMFVCLVFVKATGETAAGTVGFKFRLNQNYQKN